MGSKTASSPTAGWTWPLHTPAQVFGTTRRTSYQVFTRRLFNTSRHCSVMDTFAEQMWPLESPEARFLNGSGCEEPQAQAKCGAQPSPCDDFTLACKRMGLVRSQNLSRSPSPAEVSRDPVCSQRGVGWLGNPAPNFASFSFDLGQMLILVSLVSPLKSLERPR